MEHYMGPLLYLFVFHGQLTQCDLLNITVCSSDTNQSIGIRCKKDEIINITSTTYLYVERDFPCLTEPVNSDITVNVSMECTLNSDPLPRCHGEQYCDIAPNLAIQRLNQCCLGHLCSDSNVLYLQYNCVQVIMPNATTIRLPMDGTISAENLQILSPYFPCDSPALRISFTCEIKGNFTKSTDESLQVLSRSCVTFDVSDEDGEEMIMLDFISENTTDTVLSLRSNAQSRTVEMNTMIDRAIDTRTNKLTFTYNKRFYENGGKFVQQIQVMKNGKPIDLSISCNNQTMLSIVTQSPIHREFAKSLSHGCKPFRGIVTGDTVTDPTAVDDDSGSRDFLLIGCLIGLIIFLVLLCVVMFFLIVRKSFRKRITQSAAVQTYDAACNPNGEPRHISSSVGGTYSTVNKEEKHTPQYDPSDTVMCENSELYEEGAAVQNYISKETQEYGEENAYVIDDATTAENGETIMCDNEDLYKGNDQYNDSSTESDMYGEVIGSK